MLEVTYLMGSLERKWFETYGGRRFKMWREAFEAIHSFRGSNLCWFGCDVEDVRDSLVLCGWWQARGQEMEVFVRPQAWFDAVYELREAFFKLSGARFENGQACSAALKRLLVDYRHRLPPELDHLDLYYLLEKHGWLREEGDYWKPVTIALPADLLFGELFPVVWWRG